MIQLSNSSKYKFSEIRQGLVGPTRTMIERVGGHENFALLRKVYIFGVGNIHGYDVIVGQNVSNYEAIKNFLKQKDISVTRSSQFDYNGGVNVGLSTDLRKRSVADCVRVCVVVGLVLNNLVENL